LAADKKISADRDVDVRVGQQVSRNADASNQTQRDAVHYSLKPFGLAGRYFSKAHHPTLVASTHSFNLIMWRSFPFVHRLGARPATASRPMPLLLTAKAVCRLLIDLLQNRL
jgi:hypothetical protein